jgi:hypothetical protein
VNRGILRDLYAQCLFIKIEELSVERIPQESEAQQQLFIDTTFPNQGSVPHLCDLIGSSVLNSN